MMLFDQDSCNDLLQQASRSPRLRMAKDLRNSINDTSQRILNALALGTEVPIHRHTETAETVLCLCGKLEEIFYDEVDGQFVERERVLLSPAEGCFGMQIPAGVWHTVRVIELAVIFEAKDGAYKG